MRIRFNKPLRGDYGRAARGEVKDVADDVAKSLIGRGLAVDVGVKAKPGRRKPAAIGKSPKVPGGKAKPAAKPLDAP